MDPKDIKAVGASALGADCLPVDKDCNPLRKAILYGIDARGQMGSQYLGTGCQVLGSYRGLKLARPKKRSTTPRRPVLPRARR